MATRHSVQDMMRLMASKIRDTAASLSDSETEAFLSAIQSAERIYVMGAGRSGLVAKAFAMRLMHLGFISFVVGETITPAMQQKDLLVIFSGSGRTKTIADIADTAKEIGGRIALITSNRDSKISRMADVIVIIENQRDQVRDETAEFEIRQMTGEHKSFAPLGTLFETAAMVFADACISRLMEVSMIDEKELKNRHANIE
ncbi:MAG TPA: 6-phospho-3-hexuloisomerase [Methanoregulaceae archaeon]|nr:MAG: 3-hexulose-6-phosphate isomerase [Euryarchaeota archaeon ADurb.BinA087]HNQ25698.1 6-phospho-3-hexuloisomerase [Methanoregulaceae archaeon]HPH35539.1 6-phospho-3-hexuloisomerase [Methanoregulaceae archaeon]HPM62393.1 6-phospho-3-hexuloisomerase [Methanoregulaceae archaeon]HPX73083.1 6-phospho-3-hexuloisomerase [Methanoregulaceae archaeon]